MSAKKSNRLHGDKPNLNTPCTLMEAIQIATSAAGDAVEEYSKNSNLVMIQQSVFLTTVQDMLVSKGVCTNKEFEDSYKVHFESYKKERDAYLASLRKEAEDKVLKTRSSDEVPLSEGVSEDE